MVHSIAFPRPEEKVPSDRQDSRRALDRSSDPVPGPPRIAHCQQPSTGRGPLALGRRDNHAPHQERHDRHRLRARRRGSVHLVVRRLGAPRHEQHPSNRIGRARARIRGLSDRRRTNLRSTPPRQQAYLAVTALIGLVAVIGGALALVAASETGLAVVMIAMVGLWLIATIHHSLLATNASPTAARHAWRSAKHGPTATGVH